MLSSIKQGFSSLKEFAREVVQPEEIEEDVHLLPLYTLNTYEGKKEETIIFNKNEKENKIQELEEKHKKEMERTKKDLEENYQKKMKNIIKDFEVKNADLIKQKIREHKIEIEHYRGETAKAHDKYNKLKKNNSRKEKRLEEAFSVSLNKFLREIGDLDQKNKIFLQKLENEDKQRKEKEKRIFKNRTILESIEDCQFPLKEVSPKRILGKGQFGIVVEVLHKSQKRFCLKCMYNYHKFQTDAINRILLDVERVKHIPLHKNIVPIFLTFKAVFTKEFENFFRKENCFSNYTSNKTGFIATPIYQQDFAKFYEKRKLERKVPPFFDSKEIINFLEQLLEGICFLNECEISHRDLKGENVFVDGSNLVIGDFGSHLNFVKVEVENLTVTGQVDGFCKGGSPFYLPNEIIKTKLGKNSILNYSKCDLFAVGLIIYLSLSKFRSYEKKIEHFAPYSGWESSKYYKMREQKNYVNLPEEYDIRIRELIEKMLKIKFDERISCFGALKEMRKIKKHF